MRSIHIVVDPPFFDAVAGMLIAGEEPFVEALVAQPTIEAFHEAVLHRLARCDVVPFDLPILLPARIAFEVSSVPLSDTIMQG